MVRAPWSAFTAGLALMLALTAGARAQPPAATLRDIIREQFPAVYEKALAVYGWQLFAENAWGPLPDALPEHCVVLIHGLDEPGKLWMNAAPALTADGILCLAFTYPNDQAIRDSAALLLESLPELRQRGVRRMAVVAHSMGGLVTRELLTCPELAYSRWRGRDAVPRIARLIMLGTPNHGSPLAGLRMFAEFRDHWVRFTRGDGHLLGPLTDGTGEAAEDLKPGSAFLRELNARPAPADVALTIIAGIASPLTRERLDVAAESWARTLPDNRQAWLDDLRQRLDTTTDLIGDGVVPLESARLPGVEDTITVNATHLSMIRNVLRGSRRVPPAIPLMRARLADFATPGKRGH